MVYKKIKQKKIYYLNSNDAIISKGTGNTGNNNLEYSCDIPELCLNDWGEVQIGSLASNGASSTAIYTVRVKNISCKDVWEAKGSYPVLCSLLWNNYNSMFRDDFGITLSPQNINNITLLISDDTTNQNNGITNTVKFVICLVITEFEPEIVEYNEKVSPNKGQRMLTSIPRL
jgi:hypothetical protein